MEQVILVDDNDNQIGVADKATVHSTDTPLHQAFSLFLFNEKNELLITQRAFSKKAFPGIWSNTICGHVSPGESRSMAVVRRLKEELNIVVSEGAIQKVSDYRYRFADKQGIVENEICPIFFTQSSMPSFSPNTMEIAEWKWISWSEFLLSLKKDADEVYSPWCKEESLLVDAFLQEKNLL